MSLYVVSEICRILRFPGTFRWASYFACEERSFGAERENYFLHDALYPRIAHRVFRARLDGYERQGRNALFLVTSPNYQADDDGLVFRRGIP